MVADFCANCGAPNEIGQATTAAIESVVAGVAAAPAGVPTEVMAQLRSCGATIDPVEAPRGTYLVRLGGLPVATFNSKGVEFVDAEVGRTWMGLLHYSKVALLLQTDRSGSPAQRRQIRESVLGLDLILGQAAKAGFAVQQTGGLFQRGYELSHPGFGVVARLTVVKGTSIVADVAFASQSQFKVFSTLDELAGFLKAGQQPN